MPKEIKDQKEFLEIAPLAIECRVKRSGDIVKIKLRTKKMLYTLKVDPKTADQLIKVVECPIIEL